MKKSFLSPRQILIFITILVCAFFAHLLYGIYRLPDRIYVLAGQEAELSVGLPISVRYEPETAAAAGMGDAPVTENIFKDIDEISDSEIRVAFLGVPVKKIAVDTLPDMEVIPCGKTVGVEISAQGLMVLGTGSVSGADGQTYNPSEGKLRSGDLVLSVNGKEMTARSDFKTAVKDSEGPIEIQIKRDDRISTVFVTPVKSMEGVNQIGVWFREGTKGIGTVTYYNPENKKFGALGHGIMDVDTKKLISVRSGKIMESIVTTVKKGKKGSPGELIGEINENSRLGLIRANTPLGLYGVVSDESPALTAGEKMRIGLQGGVHTGPAAIYSNISGSEVKKYDVYIESVNRFSQDETRGMVVRITDPELLTKTNGIVQGMSGSPIIQDDRVIGAITHVFVQNPAKGYGIFIETMIRQERKI